MDNTPSPKAGAKKPGSMVIHLDEADMIRYLTDRERGRLLLALVDYAQDGVITQGFKGSLAMCYEQMRRSIDRNIVRYQDTCERNRANANKRWHAGLDTPACGGSPLDAVYANSNPSGNPIPNTYINPTVTPADTQAAARAQAATEAALAEARAHRRTLLRRIESGDTEAQQHLRRVDEEIDALLRFMPGKLS